MGHPAPSSGKKFNFLRKKVKKYMATSLKNIKRWGRTPVWGLQHPEMTDTGSAGEQQVLFATSISWTNDIKDYEQSNHLG